jgi:hypothetical protein
MANEDKGPWWVVGVQIHAAMDPTRNRVEAFLAEHAGQATDACLEFLRTIPAGVEVDLAPLVERLGEQILAHTRFLCGRADLSATQAERLMAASRQGYGRFAGAFRAEIREGRGRPGAGLLPGIEAALAAGDRCDASRSPAGAPHRPGRRLMA